MYVIQKFDDLGSGWGRSAEDDESARSLSCQIKEFPGLPSLKQVMSPACRPSDLLKTNASWVHQESTGNQPSFCIPTAPWFWYDLGGSMCVCDKAYSYSAYWQKTFTSFAFNFPHFMTPFQIYLVYQRWMWVFIYMLVNETFEEFMLAITGYWGFTFDPPYDVEPRYDSFIRDILLCGLPGLLVGVLFVSTIKVPSYWRSPMSAGWTDTGRNSRMHHLKILFQMLVLKQIPLVYNTDYGVGQWYPQNLLLITLNLTLITLFYFVNREDWPAHMSANILRFHICWGVVSTIIWFFTIRPLLDELYLLGVAVAMCIMFLGTVRLLTRRYAWASMKILGLSLEAANLGSKEYEQFVNTGNTKGLLAGTAEVKLKDVTAVLEGLSTSGKESILLSDLVALLEQEVSGTVEPEPNQESDLKEICMTEKGDEAQPNNADVSGSEVRIDHRMTVECGILILTGFIMLCVCAGEPWKWDGLMYRRHWCGIEISEGGN
eukprot:CAMPEP_0173400776 /NCGR_PEP_ID=MMETSP1356-20130122/48943_1 /TAXON_ID=77927 ORGANISM="Hemiselmis virescens, Strain PCC157" /NCGR_SAMPLE_ID=MMETSP1356 /ASSEMBLY_ACC=CAM_ASM_000847 /LENGTH=488 /DNA_ID=CAMNT_0014360775 /DNA_START=44 /DNA_END=1507 /DNA_ORIENTATION=-